MWRAGENVHFRVRPSELQQPMAFSSIPPTTAHHGLQVHSQLFRIPRMFLCTPSHTTHRSVSFWHGAREQQCRVEGEGGVGYRGQGSG